MFLLNVVNEHDKQLFLFSLLSVVSKIAYSFVYFFPI